MAVRKGQSRRNKSVRRKLAIGMDRHAVFSAQNSDISAHTAYILLVAILLAGMALAAVFYTGPYYAFDDSTYISLASQILAGRFSITSTPYALGYAVPLLVAASFEVLGQTPLAAAMPTAAEYFFTIIVAFLVGRELFGNLSGVLSAYLIIFMPFLLEYTTRVVPDMLLGLMEGAALLMLLRSHKHADHGKAQKFFAGTILGAMLFVKFGGAGFGIIPVVLLMLYIDRKGLPILLIGIAIAASAYIISFYAISGWHSSLLAALSGYVTNQALLTQATLWINFITMLDAIAGPAIIYQAMPFGSVMIFVILGTLAAIKFREKKLMYPLAAFWFMFFYLFFGTESLSSYTFITVTTRYFIMVSVPMVVIASYFMIWVYGMCISIMHKDMAIKVIVFLAVVAVAWNVWLYLYLYTYKLSIILQNSQEAPPIILT